MIVRFMVNDSDGFCHQFEENLDTASTVAKRVYDHLANDSTIKEIGISKYLTKDTCGPVRFFGWFNREDSLAYINDMLKAL